MLIWNAWYQLSPSLLVVLMAPNSGYGVSNVRREIVVPTPVYSGVVQVLPVMVVQNGFLTVAPRLVLLRAIAVVTELSVFKYLLGTAFRFRVISMSVP